MDRYFFDSSALFKRYLEEPGTGRVLELTQHLDAVVVSRLAMVEIGSAAVRLARTGSISDEILGNLMIVLSADFHERFDVIELKSEVMERGLVMARIHALRAADAVQLACALEGLARLTDGGRLAFVSSDVELNSAAGAEGFEVINPQP